MTVEHTSYGGNDRYVIKRGSQYFSLFVDHDKSAWSKNLSRIHYFSSRLDADQAIIEIRKRDNLRRRGK